MSLVRTTLTVEVVDLNGRVTFSISDSEVGSAPVACELAGVHNTATRHGGQLTGRVAAVIKDRFG